MSDYVSLLTWGPDDRRPDLLRYRLIEEGGVYPEDVTSPCGSCRVRALAPDEATVQCPQCRMRFAATENTAEDNRDLHLHGDSDCPSICRGRQ